MHKLGIETATIRVFKTKLDVRRWNPAPEPWHHETGNGFKSINHLGMEQFAELGGLSTDKYWVHGYLDIYDKLFGKLRNQKIKILELGLLHGASLKLWHQAFPKAQIYGVDKDYTRWQRFTKDLDRITVCTGRQEDVEFLKDKVIPNGKFDIIIDDCGHKPNSQMVSFKTLWPSLRNHGFYVVEDCHHSYDPRYKGINLPRELSAWVDRLYTDYTILSLQFFYNLCVIEKGVR